MHESKENDSFSNSYFLKHNIGNDELKLKDFEGFASNLYGKLMHTLPLSGLKVIYQRNQFESK